MPGEPNFNEAEIGRRIKKLRTEKGITLDELSSMTGFSKGYLSRVEKSEKAPPVSTLGRVARVLGTTISELLGENKLEKKSFSIVRKNERPLIARDGIAFGYSYEAVAYNFPDKAMEPFILTLPPKRKKRGLFQHEGEELLYVLEGTMRFYFGDSEFILEEGDCIYFDSNIPHYGESMGNRAVKCFMVIYSPR
ncbi:MAG TPA: XRE family transcriptional regulator [Syntrophales bacterium]|nr:XRE family transcriptional regulator [Syntrophales bacterium]HOL59368.1 XRE family transcriptional regulator [Syntrophales bacterium]HPO35525.1 XRE family transcriptional regulator [Syntrophales bacterium]